MRTTYLVTPEIRTTFWWKILRFLRLKKKREEFKLELSYSGYRKGNILMYFSPDSCLLVIDVL